MKEKNKTSPLKALWSLVIAAACVYFGFQLYTIMHRTYRSEIAIPYKMTDNVLLDGVVVFGESPVEGRGTIGYLVEDGARVAGGNQIAEIYSSERQAELREELTRLESRIALLQKAQNTNASGEISVIVSQMQGDLYDLLDVLDGNDLDGFQETGDAYLLSANRLQVYTGEQADYTSQIQELESRRTQVAAQLGEPATIEAQEAGYFVSANNCFFLQTNQEALDGMNPSELHRFLQGTPEKPAEGQAGKIINSYQWYYYGSCDIRTAEKFQQAGGRLQISFPGKAEEPLPVTVELVETDVDADLAKIVLRCEYTNQAVLKLCHQIAQVDFATYDGLRIDKSALHILNGQKGVYIKYGTIERWRKIEVLYENEDYILVPAKPNDNSDVKIYDEIIVEGTDLKDGNLL